MSAPQHNTGHSRLDAVLGALSSFCKVVAGISLVILTAIFGWLVWGRYVMNDTPTWVEQVSLLLVMVITFLGAAVGIRENTHLGVSYFRDAAPQPLRLVFMIVTHIVMAAFGAIMAWHSYELVLFKWGSEIPLIHLPEGLRAVPIMLCGGLVCLFSVGHLIAMARGASTRSSLTD